MLAALSKVNENKVKKPLKNVSETHQSEQCCKTAQWLVTSTIVLFFFFNKLIINTLPEIDEIKGKVMFNNIYTNV